MKIWVLSVLVTRVVPGVSIGLMIAWMLLVRLRVNVNALGWRPLLRTTSLVAETMLCVSVRRLGSRLVTVVTLVTVMTTLLLVLRTVAHALAGRLAWTMRLMCILVVEARRNRPLFRAL